MSDIVNVLYVQRLVDQINRKDDEIVRLRIRLRNQLDAARTGKALLALEAERVLCDQLAQALRAQMEPLHFDDEGGFLADEMLATAALAAYDAARKEEP